MKKEIDFQNFNNRRIKTKTRIMYTIKKVKVQLSKIELIEMNVLNNLFQKGTAYLSDSQKDRLWSLINK